MPNAEKMRATQALVESNLVRWNQREWVTGKVNPAAPTVNECGASFCWFGWGAVAEGYRPMVNKYGNPTQEFYNADTGAIEYADAIVRREHDLTVREAAAISGSTITDITKMRDRVESVIRGEWR